MASTKRTKAATKRSAAKDKPRERARIQEQRAETLALMLARSAMREKVWWMRECERTGRAAAQSVADLIERSVDEVHPLPAELDAESEATSEA